jgi:DNA-binding transcriptional MerR regulator
VSYRIDELAQKAGTTTRNIRAYQQRGLLHPPELRGRTGYYGDDHLRRLELIGELQERGFSLEAIRQTLEAWSRGGDLGHLIGFHRLVTEPFMQEEARALSADDLIALFPEAVEHPELFDAAVEQGLLRAEEEGGYVAPSPTLIDAGSELVRAGIPLGEILDLVKALRHDVASIAERFVDLIARNLVDPIAGGTATREELDRVGENVQRLRPIALEVIRPFLAQELGRAVESSLGRLGVRTEGELGATDSTAPATAEPGPEPEPEPRG